MAIPVPDHLKPRGSAASAPPRRPGSVRRTATLDFTWPDGLAGNTVLDGRARDLRTADDGAATVLARAALRMVTDPRRIIEEIGCSPELPGLRGLPRRSQELFAALHASRWKQLVLLALPAAVPELAVALRVGTAYSILVTVVAEFLMQTGGLGDMFAVTMQQFNLHRALGASVIAMALSTALYEASSALEKRVRLRFV